MAETLFHAYTPLIFWTGVGLLLWRFTPKDFPRLLGRSLYWIGVPLQILALVRRTEFSQLASVVPMVTLAALFLGLALALASLWLLKHFSPKWSNRSSCGSFILAAILGNTGFVGLAIAPFFISDVDLSWLVLYSIAHNVLGPYGFGVAVASYFGRPAVKNHWWVLVRDVLSVPVLWAFILGYTTQSYSLPASLETGLQAFPAIVIPAAFTLIGMRLSQLQGWKSFLTALLPASLKAIALPAAVGLGATLCGLSGDPRLSLVLMAGMPTAFLGLVVAEEYNLDRELIASSIVVSTILLLITLPGWLLLFG